MRIGDPVLTADEGERAVRWVDRRTYDCRSHIKPDEVLPIRVARDTTVGEIHRRLAGRADSMLVGRRLAD